MMDNLLLRDDNAHERRQDRQERRGRWSNAHDAGVDGWLAALGLGDVIETFRHVQA